MSSEYHKATEQPTTLEEETRTTTEEARMVLPGIQALFGFRLIAVFQHSISRFTTVEQVLHLIALLSVAVAIVLINTLMEIPEDVDCRVWGDKVGLQQILANILANALKFTPDGGEVTVNLRRSQATAILVIKDTGIGMSPDFLPHAFEQFAQAKSNNKQTRGLGLGLAICKHLVELFSGSISAESEGPGRGTALKVELPLSFKMRHVEKPDESRRADFGLRRSAQKTVK